MIKKENKVGSLPAHLLAMSSPHLRDIGTLKTQGSVRKTFLKKDEPILGVSEAMGFGTKRGESERVEKIVSQNVRQNLDRNLLKKGTRERGN